MNDITKQLLETVEKHPNLPLFFLVDSDVVGGDEYGWWAAEASFVDVGEYTNYNERVYTDRDEFVEDYYDRNSDVLDKRFGWDGKNDAAEKELDELLRHIADISFKKAILIHVIPKTPEIEVTDVEDD